jgi:hypothetical protein
MQDKIAWDPLRMQFCPAKTVLFSHTSPSSTRIQVLSHSLGPNPHPSPCYCQNSSYPALYLLSVSTGRILRPTFTKHHLQPSLVLSHPLEPPGRSFHILSSFAKIVLGVPCCSPTPPFYTVALPLLLPRQDTVRCVLLLPSHAFPPSHVPSRTTHIAAPSAFPHVPPRPSPPSLPHALSCHAHSLRPLPLHPRPSSHSLTCAILASHSRPPTSCRPPNSLSLSDPSHTRNPLSGKLDLGTPHHLSKPRLTVHSLTHPLAPSSSALSSQPSPTLSPSLPADRLRGT